MDTSQITKDYLETSLESYFKRILAITSEPNYLNKKWLRTSEAAEYLSISPSQLHNLKSEGIISCTKLGGTNYYDREELDQILEANKNISS